MSTGSAARALCFASIAEVAARIARRELSPVELTEAVLARCERYNDRLRAYITITRETALAQARRAEREIRDGRPKSPLHGIPVALKDNIATRGIRTSCASLVDPDHVPDDDATVYTRLRAAGAVLAGKTNLYEYAFSMSPAFPQPPNPWRHDRSSAGSSSGSGVSVAAGLAYGAIGSDTGGSGRAPANVNGVVGLKATYGRVSRHGVFPLSYSLDHTTVLARSVLDSALMLQAIAGRDERDASSSSTPVPDFAAAIGRDVRGLRVGYARGFSEQDIDPDVVAVMREALAVLARLGAEIEEVRLPYVEHCVALQSAILLAEAATIHRDHLREAPDKLGETALMRLDLGSVIPATAYIHAQQVRGQMRAAFRTLFERVDVIAGPAGATRAGEVGGWTTRVDGREIDLRSVGPEYTGIYNLAGVPAIVIPAGFSSEGTPIGLQLAARWFAEPELLRAAHAFEQATEWHRRYPPDPDDMPPAMTR
jgi:aspartyl-tRNA(Asn)/glutamyl-tRNA(Gln) amidotransferase subunit A